MEREKKKIEKIWHTQQEKILKMWGESSSCYRYMHFKAYHKLRKQSFRFTLPIIIISTITGTANFAQGTFPKQWEEYVPASIGTANLFAAILTTVMQFLKINERMEGHRVSSIAYGKLSRNIRLELSLPINDRSHDGTSMVDLCNSEYDRLIEQSPTIPGDILKDFDKKFSKISIFFKPEINNIAPIDPFNTTKELVVKLNVLDKFKNNKKREEEETFYDLPDESIDHKKELKKELEILQSKNLVSMKNHDIEENDEEVLFNELKSIEENF